MMRNTTSVRRAVSVILTAIMGIFFSFALAGCHKKSGGEQSQNQNRYYAYNVESDVFDKTEYLQIDGGACSLVKTNDGVTVTSDGTITFNGDSFTISCSSELLGINITTIMNGAREANGVLRVDSQTVSGMTATPVTEYETTYFCPDGVKPASPVAQFTITFDANGGKFDGNITSKTAKTKPDGTVALVAAPTREGYDFVGYFGHRTEGKTPISATTKFDHSMTVYARWTERSASANRYYFYDADTDMLDMGDYMEIDGTNFTAAVLYDGMINRLVGTIEFSGNSFDIDATTTVSGLTADIAMSGEREANGILRIDSMTVSCAGLVDVIDTVSYYCMNGVKPSDPAVGDKIFEITFNAAPGKFSDNTQTKKLTTGSDGKLASLPENPTRNGYKFKGFKSMYPNGYVSTDMVFNRNTTVSAEFVALHTVTFKVNGKTIESRAVEHGDKLGDLVGVLAKMGEDDEIIDYLDENNYHMLKGWKEQDSYKYYTPSTVVNDDIIVEAQFYDQIDARIYRDSMWDWSEPGHLYIHYLRSDAEPYNIDRTINKNNILYYAEKYKDWLLWAGPDNGSCRAFEPMRIGMYGVVYDIDIKRTYTDGGWDTITKTHNGETLNCFRKDIKMMFFNDASRQRDDAFWENDGGNNVLRKSTVLEYWTDDPSNTKYYFDENVSVHMLFVQPFISQEYIDSAAVMMLVYKHDEGVVWGI